MLVTIDFKVPYKYLKKALVSHGVSHMDFTSSLLLFLELCLPLHYIPRKFLFAQEIYFQIPVYN